MAVVDETKIKEFETPEHFSSWLEVNHKTETELWLKIYKKGSGQPSIDWNNAVIEALCWGWIDGIKKSLDDKAYLQRLTPRRKNSVWSKRNTEHVERLITLGRMQEVGLVHVTAAKADGRWLAAYTVSSQTVIPDDFLKALDNNAEAKAHFDTLTKTKKRIISYGLDSAKKAETRQGRFDKFMTMLENKDTFV